ncbi:MAG: hypothetical protein QM653_03675 [Dysgonomonas sp.]|uniref:hypothetical protein n=1 Tax=Dysgonomonas sp. TaxID=1891233 RepID=UPI0039E5CB7C
MEQKDVLINRANTIINETQYFANDGPRVGGLIKDVVEYADNISQGQVSLGTVANLTALNAIVNPAKGDRYIVSDQINPTNSLPYYYVWSGSAWVNTGETIINADAATKTDLATKTPILDTLKQGSYNYYNNFRWTKGKVGFAHQDIVDDSSIKDESLNTYFDYKGKFLQVVASQNGVARDYRVRTSVNLPIGAKIRITAEFYLSGLELLDVKTIPNNGAAYSDSTQRIHNGFTLYNYEHIITETTNSIDLYFALQPGNNVSGGIIRIGRIYIGTANQGSLDGDNISLQESKEYTDTLKPSIDASFSSLFETNLNNIRPWALNYTGNGLTYDAANYRVYTDTAKSWYDNRFGVLIPDVRKGDTVTVLLETSNIGIYGTTYAQSSYNAKYSETATKVDTDMGSGVIRRTVKVTATYDHAFLHVWNHCQTAAASPMIGYIKAISVTKLKRNTNLAVGLNSGYVNEANTILTDYSAVLKGQESSTTRMITHLVVKAKEDGYVTVNTGFIEQTNKYNLNKTYRIPVKQGINYIQNLNILILSGETPQFLLDNIYAVSISGQRTLDYFTVMTNAGESEPLTTRTDLMPAILYGLENAAFEVVSSNDSDITANQLTLIAPNQKKYRVLVRENGDLYTIGNYFTKGAILGNSYTWHGLASAENPATGQIELFWWGTWGMAATEMSKDYAHLLIERIKAVNPSFTCTIKNVSEFEINHATYTDAQIDALIADVVFADTDLISINLGGNAASDGWGDSFGRFLDRLHAKAPNAFILASGTPTTGSIKTESMKQASENRGIRYISTLHLNQSEYKSSIGTQVYGNDGQLHSIWLAGVANHLGDIGHQAYADLFAKELFL